MAVSQVIAERYELIDLIDEGGMGQVFRARDLQTNEIVAVKALKESVVAQDPTLVDRFCREALVLRKLSHPNIVRVYDTFEEEGRHYIIMEYISGGSLARIIRSTGPLAIERAVLIALDLADALARTHRLEVIHRDLKPANVLLAEDGTPRLTDFGVAHTTDAGTMLTQVGSMLGTIAYLSPEVSEGNAHTEKSDIWSFGIILFEMVVGRHPFNETTPANMLTAILRKPVPDLRVLRPEVPEPLVLLLEHMLEKDPNERVPSAREIGAELERILNMLRREAADLRGLPVSTPVVVSRFDTPLTPLTPVRGMGATEIDPPTTIGPTPTSTAGAAFTSTGSATPQSQSDPRRITGENRPVRVTNPRIFIAYRREDSGEVAGRLYDQLTAVLGENEVVRDVDRYADRTVSRYVLANDVLGSVDVMLVLVGPGWVGMPRDRRTLGRAIDNPKDSMRMQIEAGLRRPDVLTIPVLVNGGTLPDDLPLPLAPLRDKQAFAFTPDQPFDPQVKKLVRQIREHFGLSAGPRRRWLWIGAAAVLAVLLLAALLLLPALLAAPVVSNPAAEPAVVVAPAVEPIGPGEVMVLMADLEPLDGSTREAARWIAEDLTQRLERDSSVQLVRVRRLNQIITSAEQARAQAEAVGAAVVVWGNHTAEAVNLEVQVGSIAWFATSALTREQIESVANLRLRLTDERTQTIAPNVLAIFSLLFAADGDSFELLRTLLIQEEQQGQRGEIVNGGMAGLIGETVTLFLSDSAAALNVVDQAVSLGGSPLVYSLRAQIRQRRGDFAGAEQDIATTERLAPQWVMPAALRANRLVVEGDYAGAVAEYDKIVAARPNDWFPVNYRGALHYVLTDYEAARIDYERAIALGPEANFPYPLAALIAMRDARIMDARTYMRAVLQDFPDPNLAQRTINALYGGEVNLLWGPLFSAFTNLVLGQYDQVLSDTTQALAIAPQVSDLYALEGLAYCNLRDLDKAFASYTAGLAIEPESPLLLVLRSEIEFERGNAVEALGDLARAYQADATGQINLLMSSSDISCVNFFATLTQEDDSFLQPPPLPPLSGG